MCEPPTLAFGSLGRFISDGPRIIKRVRAREVKGAIQIAGEIARFSVLLYGNEVSHDKLKAMVEKMTKKPAA